MGQKWAEKRLDRGKICRNPCPLIGAGKEGRNNHDLIDLAPWACSRMLAALPGCKVQNTVVATPVSLPIFDYRSFTEQYFDSCGTFKDAVIAIIATVAKQERIRISQRVKAGLETARAKGKRIGRPPRTLLSVETRTAIADSYMGGGTSLRVLAKKFGTSLATVQRCVGAYPR